MDINTHVDINTKLPMSQISKHRKHFELKENLTKHMKMYEIKLNYAVLEMYSCKHIGKAGMYQINKLPP